MKSNMGTIDRILRGTIGVVAFAIGYYSESWWGALGVIPLGTALFAWCPIYLPFGFSSRKTD